MKVEINVLDDHLDLLYRIRKLPKVIDDHLGKFPNAFPGSLHEVEEIQQQVANLEFKCKKMIFDTSIMRDQLSEVLRDIKITSPLSTVDEED